MADSDDEYVQDARSSSDDADLSMTGSGHASSSARPSGSRSTGGGGAASRSTRNAPAGGKRKKVTGQARWEASAQSLGLQESVDGGITGVLERDLEAMKRAR